MVQTLGNATTGNTHPDRPLDLPRPAATRQPHRPWCTDCKRTHDAAQLDDRGRCARCARTVESRTSAAERRRLADEADAKAARGKPVPRKAEARTADRRGQSDRRRRRTDRALDAHRDSVIQRYASGESANAIASTHAVTPQTVIRFLRANDVLIRGRGGHPIKTGDTSC